MAPADDTPGYCQVMGYVTPNVGFLLRLPLTNWNGKFMEQGCWGYCGTTQQIVGCSGPLRRGYACMVTDDGHTSTVGDDLWAYHNLQGGVDHGYRAAHVTALAGKAIVERYFSRAPQRSYFMGCSTGGRQALVEAQRFPWDFDGIVAGAPAGTVPGSHLTHIWWLRAMTDRDHKPLFRRTELELAHAAVLKQCDMDDGLRDGLIGDPLSCKFDPASLQCRSNGEKNCLSHVQAEALTKAYGGPRTSRGELIYPGRAFPGSELNLPYRELAGSEMAATFEFIANEFRYSAFDPPAGPNWQVEDFDFDRDFKRLGVSDSLSAARDPDLRRFKAAGGKLIAYVGYNDIDQADVTIDYYTTVERTMGGRRNTQEFFRLFVFPGMNHCTLGEGPFAADYLQALETWVEQDQAPDRLIASHVRVEDLDPGDFEALARRLEFPLDPAMITFSRPVYPYPLRTRYLGRGDPNDARSFGPVGAPER